MSSSKKYQFISELISAKILALDKNRGPVDSLGITEPSLTVIAA